MLGQRLREARTIRGHTQESLAEMLHINKRQITRYENNETEPNGETIAMISRALETSADYLLGLTDDPSTKHSELTAIERRVIDAIRRGSQIEAVKAIVNG